MKRIKHFALALVAVFLLSSANYVHASELAAADNATIQAIGGVDLQSVSRTYTFGRTKQTYTVGRYGMYPNSQITLYMPRNNGLSLVQGTIYLVPSNGGSQITKSFGNYASDTQTISLADVPEGVYMIKIEGAAVGTNTSVRVDLTLTP
ncbi:MAG: hypothetical protein K2K63_07915 [Acetatifactor sp.]|nr:hypothetical protein [Acetatifactor sp.]